LKKFNRKVITQPRVKFTALPTYVAPVIELVKRYIPLLPLLSLNIIFISVVKYEFIITGFTLKPGVNVFL